LVSARAATTLGTILTSTSITCWAFAHQFALWLRAGDGLLALPVALGGFAHRSTNGVRSFALSAAVSWGANSFTLRAILLFAQILRASNVALWFIAVDLALSAFSLFAVNLALWSLAHRVADSWTHWIIALPSAFWMAITFDFSNSGHEISLSDDSGEG